MPNEYENEQYPINPASGKSQIRTTIQGKDCPHGHFIPMICLLCKLGATTIESKAANNPSH